MRPSSFPAIGGADSPGTGDRPAATRLSRVNVEDELRPDPGPRVPEGGPVTSRSLPADFAVAATRWVSSLPGVGSGGPAPGNSPGAGSPPLAFASKPPS